MATGTLGLDHNRIKKILHYQTYQLDYPASSALVRPYPDKYWHKCHSEPAYTQKGQSSLDNGWFALVCCDFDISERK